MKVKVQCCIRRTWTHGRSYVWRALIGGGILTQCHVPHKWGRKDATRMLNALESEGFDRKSIRFELV